MGTPGTEAWRRAAGALAVAGRFARRGSGALSPASRGRRRSSLLGLLGAALAALALWSSATPGAGAPGQTDPLGDADQRVADAQAAADDAAEAYFVQLDRLAELKVEIAETEDRLADLEGRVETLQRTVEERAALAYLRAGSTGPFDLRGGDAMEPVRRGTLLDTLNDADNEAAAELNDATEQLAERRDQLKEGEQAQEETVARLAAEEATLNAALTEAQAERGYVAAQQQAAARAASERERDAANGGGAPSASDPPPPPPNYSPTPGTHPHHNDPFLSCTRQRESGGNYHIDSSGGTYHGAYQFLRSTWDSAANHAGRGELVGVDPHQASEYDQDDMAWTLYQWQGKGPWGGRC